MSYKHKHIYIKYIILLNILTLSQVFGTYLSEVLVPKGKIGLFEPLRVQLGKFQKERHL